jgi:hypothetical protein
MESGGENMNVGPMGMLGGAAGSPLSQSQGTDVNKAQQDTTDQSRKATSENKAEQASGVGQTEHDEEASDRDADGRRPWEIGGRSPEDTGDDQANESETPQQSKDPSGTRGGQLDVSG